MLALVRDLVWDLAKNAIGAGVGLVITYLVYRFRETRRYGGWAAVLREGDVEIGRQPLGVETARSWLRDSWPRKIGLKSLCSDYGRTVKTNVLDISTIDNTGKQFVVQFDWNPKG